MEYIKRFEENLYGKDYVVGDIHGCFSKLQRKLDSIGFDPAFDRLFSVGDLTDRGPESEDALDWLIKPWFHAVRGNHEQMLIDAWKDDNSYSSIAAGNLFTNGGAWYFGLPEPEQRMFHDFFDELPFGMEIVTDKGIIGIVHAEVPMNDWAIFKDLFENNYDRFSAVSLWARSKIERGNTQKVLGIDHVYVGHTPVSIKTTLGNVSYIDTGAVFNRDFTIIRIQ